jgi:hypothetical protein
MKNNYKSKSPDKRDMGRILKETSSENSNKSETNKKSDQLPQLNIKKMFTQSSNQSLTAKNNETQEFQMNPNEAEFIRQEIRKPYKRERSDIIKRLSADSDNSVNKSPSNFARQYYQNPTSISK